MEANFAHFALQELHILPSQFLDMSEEEKVFVIASTKLKIEARKKEEERIEQEKNRLRR